MPRYRLALATLLTCAPYLLAPGFSETRGAGRGESSAPASLTLSAVPGPGAGHDGKDPSGGSRRPERTGRRFSKVREGAWWILNAGLGLQARVTRAGATVAAADWRQAGWSATFRLAGYGREGALLRAAEAAPVDSGDGLEVRRKGLIEWYRNEPGGVFLGFTLTTAFPAGTREAPLVLQMEWSGNLEGRLGEAGRSVMFRTVTGREVLRCGGLEARDSRGLEVPARFTLSPKGIQLRVEDQGAIYPLRIATEMTGAVWSGEGSQSGDAFGASVGPAGDVNGDGYGDFIVGAPYSGEDAFRRGRVYVYLGAADGVSPAGPWIADGEQEAANLGWSVAAAGDVDGDGYDDVVVGEPGISNGEFFEGRALIYRGSPSGLEAEPAWIVEGDRDFSTLGFSVAGAGDVNGDGFADVLIGAPDNGDFSLPGRAMLFLGSAGGPAEAAAWTGQGGRPGCGYGWSVASAGDSDGDGLDDVLIGAPRDYSPLHDLLSEGRVFLHRGTTLGSGVTPDPSWEAWGGRRAGFFGSSVASAGDFNGDHFADLVVGAENTSGAAQEGGRVAVFPGSATGPAPVPAWSREGGHWLGHLGTSVAGAGDLDGDGYADVVVGEPDYDRSLEEESVGRAYVYRGSADGLPEEPSWTLEGDSPFGMLGQAVAPAGDLNGDGVADLIVGIPSDGRYPGRARVSFGTRENRPPEARITAPGQAECTSPAGAEVSLSGSLSSDPDSAPGTHDDIQTFEWFRDYGQPSQLLLGSGEALSTVLPLGTHPLTLRVTDRGGATGTATVTLQVADTTPPRLTLALSPRFLWPPTHRMVPVHADVRVSDTCGEAAVTLVSVTSDELDDAPGPDDGSTLADIQGIALGTPDFDFKLRAERSDQGDGRLYTAIYRATDAAGNPSTAAGFVSVPYSVSGGAGSIRPPRREGAVANRGPGSAQAR